MWVRENQRNLFQKAQSTRVWHSERTTATLNVNEKIRKILRSNVRRVDARRKETKASCRPVVGGAAKKRRRLHVCARCKPCSKKRRKRKGGRSIRNNSFLSRLAIFTITYQARRRRARAAANAIADDIADDTRAPDISRRCRVVRCRRFRPASLSGASRTIAHQRSARCTTFTESLTSSPPGDVDCPVSTSAPPVLTMKSIALALIGVVYLLVASALSGSSGAGVATAFAIYLVASSLIYFCSSLLALRTRCRRNRANRKVGGRRRALRRRRGCNRHGRGRAGRGYLQREPSRRRRVPSRASSTDGRPRSIWGGAPTLTASQQRAAAAHDDVGGEEGEPRCWQCTESRDITADNYIAPCSGEDCSGASRVRCRDAPRFGDATHVSFLVCLVCFRHTP